MHANRNIYQKSMSNQEESLEYRYKQASAMQT